MTKPLPQRDVEATPTRQGAPRLTAVESKALESIPDEALKKVIGELLIASRSNQENFQALEQWFPIQSQDIHAVSGLPFRQVVRAEIEGEKGKIINAGEGLTVQRLSTGVYRVLVEEGFSFDAPADYVSAVPQVAVGTQAVAIDVEPTEFKGAKGWLVHLFQNVASSTPVDSTFYFFAANFVDAEGNTIVGPRGPAGPTHKSLLSGAGAPGEEVGEVDDFYVDIENFVFYGPKTKEGWGEGSSLVGPQGEKGEKGEKGAEGPGGQSGFRYIFSTNTESSDPGAGKLKLNNATVSSATLMRISETDNDGNNLAAFLATIDDSTNPVKGTLIIRKEKTPSVFAVFQTSGILNDNGTWDSFTIAHVASNGLANGDEVVIQFYRAGDKGPKELLESEDVIEWKQESKTLREKLRGWYDGVSHILESVAGEGEEANLITKLLLYGGGSKLLARVVAKVGAEEVLLLSGEGKSSFRRISPAAKITDYGLVTALPASPNKGDTCQYIADKTNGIIWDLVYDGEGTYPWKKIGGSPLYERTATIESSASSYSDSETSIPKLTYPLSGDYYVGFGVAQSLRSNITGDSGFIRAAYFSNKVLVEEAIGRFTSNGGATVNDKVRSNGCTAGQQADTRYKNDAGNSTAYAGIYIELDPIRVK